MTKAKTTKSEPIRILQFIGSLDVGGSQSMIINLYKNIDRSKMQFDFVIDRKGEEFYRNEVESLGGRVFVLDEYFNGSNILEYKKQWDDFFKEHPEYKIIHCHVRSVASIVLKIAKKYNLKTICHSHSISNGKGLKAIVKKILQGRIRKYCDYYFACSKEAAEWLYGEKISNSDKCVIINNAIDVDEFRFNKKFRNEIRKKYLISDDVYLVGHIGRFVTEKNHKFILRLLNELANNDSIVFMLCGDGDNKKEFCKEVKSMGLEKKVIIIPNTKEANKLYSAFDLFILPSLYEGLGMVLIEAQFSGLECLVSPNIPREAKISNNYIVKDLSVSEWAKKILEKKKIKDRTNVQLYEESKKYNAKQAVKQFEDFYFRCLDEKGVR